MADLSRGQKVRLGIFVGTGVAVLAVAVFVLAGRALTEERDDYLIRFSGKNASFSGLSVGSDVTYSGIRIGRVERLAVASDDVSVIEVGITVTKGTPIASDSKASLGSKGITGMKYIDVSRGSADVALRKPGDTIPAGESLIDELSVKAMSIGDKLDALLVNLKAMTGADSQATVQKILEETSGLLTDNRKNIAAIISNAKTVTDDAVVVTRNFAKASEQTVGLVKRADRIMADLESASANVRRSTGPKGNVAATLTKVGTLMHGLNMVVLRSQGDIDVTLRQLRDASADLRDFSQAIKDNPMLLMFSGDDKSDKRIGK